MAITQTVTCDVCGIQRKEANHWFTSVSQNGQVSFYPGPNPTFARTTTSAANAAA